jgi:hypothetical protein
VCQGVGKKILEVERNDRLRSAGYGGCMNMAFFGVIGHCLDKCFLSFYPGIGEVNFQLTEQMRGLLRSQTQLDFESPPGFLDDVLRPAWQVERTRQLREAQQRIAERRIDQNASIEGDLKIGTHSPGSNTLSWRPRSSASRAI